MIYITRAHPRCVAPRAPLKKYNNDLIFCERTLIHSLFLSPFLFCSFLSFFAVYLFVSIYLSLSTVRHLSVALQYPESSEHCDADTTPLTPV